MVAALSRLAALAFASLAVLAPQTALSAPPALVTGSQPEFIQGGPSVKVLRERKVNLDLGSLAKAARDTSRVLEIRLFDDAVFHMHVQRTESTHSGGLAYAGPVLGSPFSTAVIVDNAGVISAMVVADGRRFSLQGSPDRGYTSREMLAYDRPDHDAKTRIDVADSKLLRKSVPGAKANPTRKPPPVAASDVNNILDVMVVYTPAARTANGGTAQINANIDAQVTLTNTIYGNSNAFQRLRLVYKGEVGYTEVDFDTDLERVTTPNDGFMDEVPILRNLYQADVVSLWGDYSDACGLAWFMVSESAGFENLAYSVVASPDCTGAAQYTFAHELGHNMGLAHDNYVDNETTTVTLEAGGATMDIAYAHGYVDLTNRFRTVLAYDDQCFDSIPTFSCLRIPYFSNPLVNYDNFGFYALAVNAPTGSAVNAHERQALNDTRETTQNFRQALATLTGPGIVAFLPTAYSVVEAGGNVVLTVGRHVGSTGAISVQYTTANGTATAGSDYTLTSGTLNWAAGDTANKTITVPILPDLALEGTETFTVSLTTPTGGASIGSSGGSSQAVTVRIFDDEPDIFPVSAQLPGGYVSPNNPNPNTPSTVWSVDTSGGYFSTSSLRSAQAYSPETPTPPDIPTLYGNSDLEYTGVFLTGDVSFFYRLSSYDTAFWSGFEFMVDGVVVASSPGGEVDWTNVTHTVTAGTHTLRWRFKNKLWFPCGAADPPPAGGDNCADRVWIDSIVLPLARPFDLDANRKSDLLLRHTDGSVYLWIMDTYPVSGAFLATDTNGWSVTHVADFDGDGKADILMKHTDGSVKVIKMNGSTVVSGALLLGSGTPWTVTHVGDVNGDARVDLILRNTDGSVYIWTMNGVPIGGGFLGTDTNGWLVTHVADFNGDGKADIVMKHTDGSVKSLQMNGAAITAGYLLLGTGTPWTVTHTGDVNGDGTADITLRHTNGSVYIWTMNGAPTGGNFLGTDTNGWVVTHMADFNGDGRSDIVMKHTDGSVKSLLMNGTNITAGYLLLGSGTPWTVTHTLDTTGDGKAEIILQHTDQSMYIWVVDGLPIGGAYLLLGANPWTLVPPMQ